METSSIHFALLSNLNVIFYVKSQMILIRFTLLTVILILIQNYNYS
jgi:hypothetical protein